MYELLAISNVKCIDITYKVYYTACVINKQGKTMENIKKIALKFVKFCAAISGTRPDRTLTAAVVVVLIIAIYYTYFA